MTIYKWWPSKGALALDGYFHRVDPELAFPDTGDIEADLRAQLHSFLRVIRDSPAGRVIARVDRPGSVGSGAESRVFARYSSPRRAMAVAAMEKAKERGQLRAGLDAETVVDQLWGACYHRLLLPDQPLTDEFVDALVDNLFRGIAE